ncbi:hypothetical protein ABMY26_06805 (plasmid) [Azospirillum sp. HJ39]|uniref:hypothetical protein n=1 Tax=Azospirillum sp. HJ39 TaxID=3159496 RepID=UPI0035582A0F
MGQQLFPGLVFVFQPAFGNYRAFLTGGMTDPSRWIFGWHNGFQSFPSLKDIGQPTKKISRGVYALA